MKLIQTSFRNSPFSLTEQHLVNSDSKEWCDSVVSEGTINRNELFKKFERSRLTPEQEGYKKARCKIKKLIAEKKETTLK